MPVQGYTLPFTSVSLILRSVTSVNLQCESWMLESKEQKVGAVRYSVKCIQKSVAMVSGWVGKKYQPHKCVCMEFRAICDTACALWCSVRSEAKCFLFVGVSLNPLFEIFAFEKSTTRAVKGIVRKAKWRRYFEYGMDIFRTHNCRKFFFLFC